MAKYLERLGQRARMSGRLASVYSEQAGHAGTSMSEGLDDPFEHSVTESPGEDADHDIARAVQVSPVEPHLSDSAVRSQSGLDEPQRLDPAQPPAAQSPVQRLPILQPATSAEGQHSGSARTTDPVEDSGILQREASFVEMTAEPTELNPSANTTVHPADDSQPQTPVKANADNATPANPAEVVIRSAGEPAVGPDFHRSRASNTNDYSPDADSASPDTSISPMETITRILSPDLGRERPAQDATSSALHEPGTVSIGTITVELTPPAAQPPQPAAPGRKAASRSSMSRGKSAARSRNSFGLGQV